MAARQLALFHSSPLQFPISFPSQLHVLMFPSTSAMPSQRALPSSAYADAPASVHTLCSASLVCREWISPAQSVLFLHVRLQSRKHAATFSQAALGLAPPSAPLAACVHTIEVSMCADPSSSRDNDDGRSSVHHSKKRRGGSKKDISWADIGVLLACCPYLVELRIKNANGSPGAGELVLPHSLRSLTVSGEASTEIAYMIGRHAQQLTALSVDLLPMGCTTFDEASTTAFVLAQSIFGAAGRLRTLSVRNAAWLAPVLPANPACATTLHTLALDAWTPQLAGLLSSGALPHLETFELSGCRGGFQLPATKTLVSVLPETLVHLRLSLEPWTLTLTGRDEIEAAAVEDIGLPATLRSIVWERNAFVPMATALETALGEACVAHGIEWRTQQMTPPEDRVVALDELEAIPTLQIQAIQPLSPDVQQITVPKRGPMRKAISWASRVKRNVMAQLKPWEY